MNEQLTISLTRTEALVLQAFLATFEDAPTFRTLQRADQMALYALHAALENEMADLFDPNYDQLLAQARTILQGENEE